MSEELVNRQLARLRALLSEERTGVSLIEAEAQPGAEEAGALHAIGYRTARPEVDVSVYIFPDWSKHRETGARLMSEFSGDKDVYARTAANGPMLFFAHTRLSSGKGREAEHRLDQIMTAFAGDE